MMHTCDLPMLSETIQALLRRFDRFDGIADTEVVQVTGEEGRLCSAMLGRLHHLALIQERELKALRFLVGDLTSEITPGKAQKSGDGKVVQFRRRSPSKPKLI